MTKPTLQRDERAGFPDASKHAAKKDGPVWQVQTAKARFSEVFRLARTEGPQRITRQGKDSVVLISAEHYDRLTVRSGQPKSLVQFFRESPLAGIELDWERARDTGRDVDF